MMEATLKNVPVIRDNTSCFVTSVVKQFSYDKSASASSSNNNKVKFPGKSQKKINSSYKSNSSFKCIPYKKRNNNEKKSIRGNTEKLKQISTIGSVIIRIMPYGGIHFN